jgi:hypothetical protein
MLRRSALGGRADIALIKRVRVDPAVLHHDLEIVRLRLAVGFASPLNDNLAEVAAALLEAECFGQLF